jgi:hypothetical protein
MPAPEGTGRVGDDKHRVAGLPAGAVALSGVRAIWAATWRFEVVGVPRRGYDFLFKLDQIFLFLGAILGARTVVVCRRLRVVRGGQRTKG